MLVRDVMVRSSRSVRPEMMLAEIARLMKQDNIGVLPVVRDDEIVGMITVWDIALQGVSENANPWTLRAEDVMTTGAATCPEDVEVEVATAIMEEHGSRGLIVVNEQGVATGSIAVGDVARLGTPRRPS